MSTVVVFDNTGNTSATGDLILTDGPLYASFTASVSGTLHATYELVLSNPATTSGSFQAALYADNSTTPGTLIATMDIISDTSVTTTTAGVYTFTSTNTPSVTSGTRYWIGLSNNVTTGINWAQCIGNSGTGVAGEFYVTLGTVTSNNTGTPYQMQISIDQAVPCLHPDTRVLTPQGYKVISELRAKDDVIDFNGNVVPILSNLRCGTTNVFINIMKDSLGKDKPEKDLLIRKEHVILYNGKEAYPGKLAKKISTIMKNKLEKAVPVYSLCTKERTFVMMDGIPVETLTEDIINSESFLRKFRYTKL